jgi:hypothetical protein
MSTLVTRSRQSCRKSLKLVERSRKLIAVSRRALNPAWRISGAADGGSRRGLGSNPEALRLAIRRRLREETLFVAPSRVWSGSGRGRICVVCDDDISGHEIENEMILGPVTLWAHLACYDLAAGIEPLPAGECRTAAGALTEPGRAPGGTG